MLLVPLPANLAGVFACLCHITLTLPHLTSMPIHICEWWIFRIVRNGSFPDQTDHIYSFILQGVGFLFCFIDFILSPPLHKHTHTHTFFPSPSTEISFLYFDNQLHLKDISVATSHTLLLLHLYIWGFILK
uniref:Uncharacterized protein n=1 Tax=Octopus bimaculoides TaxID=37653 RepID=A0A0L8I3K5_OCTBM